MVQNNPIRQDKHFVLSINAATKEETVKIVLSSPVLFHVLNNAPQIHTLHIMNHVRAYLTVPNRFFVLRVNDVIRTM